jgi:hypothetical protein
LASVRYREEIELFHRSNQFAVRESLRQAGRIILVSGSTLALCFLGLALFPLEFLASAGFSASVAVICTMVVNLTLVPALLIIFGWFFSDFSGCRLPAWMSKLCGDLLHSKEQSLLAQDDDDDEAALKSSPSCCTPHACCSPSDLPAQAREEEQEKEDSAWPMPTISSLALPSSSLHVDLHQTLLSERSLEQQDLTASVVSHSDTSLPSSTPALPPFSTDSQNSEFARTLKSSLWFKLVLFVSFCRLTFSSFVPFSSCLFCFMWSAFCSGFLCHSPLLVFLNRSFDCLRVHSHRHSSVANFHHHRSFSALSKRSDSAIEIQCHLFLKLAFASSFSAFPSWFSFQVRRV